MIEADEPGHAEAIARLVERYAQYRVSPPRGSVISVSVDRWSAWRA